MIAVLNWLLAHWGVFFLLGFFGVFGAIRDFIVDVARALGGHRRRKDRELSRRVRKLEAAQAAVPAGTPGPKPGRCVHRNVTAVVGTDDTVVAWLCRSCDTQLPADWAVREEDL